MHPAPQKRPELRLVEGRAPIDEPLPISRRVFALLVAGAIGLGFLVRASFIFGSDFPLNDGGMFFQMARDLQANGYALPDATSYNNAGIPFAYPPFGFYVAGLLDEVTPLNLVDVFRALPLVADTLLLWPFLLLARRFLATRAEALIALTIFALLPPSFTWMLMGGGVARATGFIFALFTIQQAQVMFTQPRAWRPVAVGALAALTVVSHLEMAWFAALSCGVLYVASGHGRRATLDAATVVSVAVALSAPWWVTVLVQHGTTPFIAAAGAGGGAPLVVVAHLLQFRVTAEPLFSVFGALGLLGMLVCVARRQYLLPAWVVACAALDPRAFPTSASVPVAMLAAMAAHDVLLPLVRPDDEGANRAPRWLLPSLLIGVTLYGFLGAMLSSPERLTGMTRGEREAMAWARANTPEDAEFAIVSGDAWPIDRTSEWFPALAERRSVATVQGYEWMRGEFRPRIDGYMELQECADGGVACLEEWASETGESFGYVYIPKLAPRVEEHPDGDECCAPLVRELIADPRYDVAYDGPGAVIFERN